MEEIRQRLSVKTEQLKKIFEGTVLMAVFTLAVISAVASYASTTEDGFTLIFMYSLISAIGLACILLFLNKNKSKELSDLGKAASKIILWIKRRLS